MAGGCSLPHACRPAWKNAALRLPCSAQLPESDRGTGTGGTRKGCPRPRGAAQGITLKLRYNRAGHLFEFPILLSTSPLHWPTLAGAYLLPPLLYLGGRDLVVGPLARGIAARR